LYGVFVWVRDVLNSQKRRFPARAGARDRRPNAAANPHIWTEKGKGPTLLSSRWEAAVDDVVRSLTPLTPAHADRLRGVMIGDELVCGHFPLANLSALAQV
jgi:hypothetical protein